MNDQEMIEFGSALGRAIFLHDIGQMPEEIKKLKYDVPKEVSTREAAKILGVSKDTVLRLKKAGLLKWRNSAPPTSSRPVFKFKLKSVMKLRTEYQKDEPPIPERREEKRHARKKKGKFKHFKYDD